MTDKEQISSSNVIKKYFFDTYLYTYIIFGVVAVFLSSYGGYKLSQVLSHPIIDNGCTKNIPGAGQHCWGDFSGPLIFASSQAPWSGGLNPYPPFATMLFEPFAYIANNFDTPNLSLIVFLVLCLASVIYPPLHLYLTKEINKRGFIQGVVLMISSAPVLVAFDRGNFILLLVPLLYHTTKAGMKSDPSFVPLLIVLGCFRPQFFILLSILLANGQIKRFIYSVLSSGLMFISSFLVYPKFFFQNIQDYFDTLLKYQNYQFVGVPWPVNISINNTVMTLYRAVMEVVAPNRARTLEGTWTFLPSFLVYGVILAILIIRYQKIKQLTPFEKLFLFLTLSVVIPNVSFTYYLIFIPILLLFPILDVKSIVPIFSDTKNQNLVFITSILILVNFLIPWSLIPSLKDESWSDISMNWLAGQTFLLITALIFIFGRKSASYAD
jgi:hypothetical protein